MEVAFWDTANASNNLQRLEELAVKEVSVNILAECELKEQRLQGPHTKRNILQKQFGKVSNYYSLQKYIYKKRTKTLNRHFIKEDTQRAKKYMKRCLASLTIRKIQIKTTLHITEWLVSKN